MIALPVTIPSQMQVQIPSGLNSPHDLFGKTRPSLSLVLHFENAVDHVNFLSVPEHTFFYHAVFPKPVSYFTPVPKWRLIADFTHGRREPARASASVYVLMHQLAASSDLPRYIRLRNQVAVVNPQNIRTNLRAANIVDGA